MQTPFCIHVRTLTGLEAGLADELRALGAADVQVDGRLVRCRGDRRLLYRANVFCRTAIRVLLPVHAFAAPDEKSLYEGIRQVEWSRWLDPRGRLAVDPVVRSAFTTHSLFVAQLAKDAVVDQFRERTGKRPSVDLKDPDLRIHLVLHGNQAQLFVDASGESLHRRGYRTQAGEAPLNEVLAAGILRLAGWDASVPLLDPFSGSGTLPIEAALMARHIAPGLLRRRFGYQKWPDYEEALHRAALGEAENAVRPQAGAPIFARDIDPRMAMVARGNARRAGVDGDIRFGTGDFLALPPPEPPGIVVMNPPYDERLPVDDVRELYARIGDRLKQAYGGWTAWVLAGSEAGAKSVGLRTSRRVVVFNGPIECRLLGYELRETTGEIRAPAWRDPEVAAQSPRVKRHEEDFANRLRKNARHLGKWARRQGVTCYRVYDADIPEIPLLVDRYGDRLVVAEREHAHGLLPAEHEGWIRALLRAAGEVLEVPEERIHFKRRRPQSGSFQYGPVAETGEKIPVQEGGHRFLVNLTDYVDTGLFLDHRQTRAMVEAEARDKDFLNLFAYTGSFTVYAAAGGARSTTTVDTSRTYLKWAEENLALNGLGGGRHRFVRADAGEFLERDRGEYDLAVVDPPTYSNNKSTGRVFEVQRDHRPLLEGVLRRMRPGGVIYFSTNFRGFRFEGEGLAAEEITARTLPPDFERGAIHRAWRITKA